MIRIYIPTRDRLRVQRTWNFLPEELRKNAALVCSASESAVHMKQNRSVMACPVQGISGVRQWLVDLEKEKFVMTDDDHYMYRRVSPSSPKLRKADGRDLVVLYSRIEKLLDEYPMVGVSARQGNDAYLGLRDGGRIYEIRPGLTLNKRTCNMYGIRPDVLKKEGIRFDEVPLMEDMHVCLSLIARGYNVALITEFAWNQEASGVAGGCSSYRSYELQREAALKLARLHRPFVTVVKKLSKDKDGKNWKTVGAERFDVRVDWTGAAAGGRRAAKRGFASLL